MKLPPKDSSIWTRLEDAAAAEEGEPLFDYGAMRGPANASKRRSYFQSLVAYHRKPLILRLLLFCCIVWGAQVALFLYLGHRPLSGLLWAFLGAAIGSLGVALAFELPRRRRFAQAVRRYSETPAPAP